MIYFPDVIVLDVFLVDSWPDLWTDQAMTIHFYTPCTIDLTDMGFCIHIHIWAHRAHIHTLLLDTIITWSRSTGVSGPSSVSQYVSLHTHTRPAGNWRMSHGTAANANANKRTSDTLAKHTHTSHHHPRVGAPENRLNSAALTVQLQYHAGGDQQHSDPHAGTADREALHLALLRTLWSHTHFSSNDAEHTATARRDELESKRRWQ